MYVECVPVSIVICSDLPPLTNGDIDYGAGSPDSRLEGTVATYTCGTGYTLSGVSSTNRTCESDGVWSGFAPTCQRKWNELCTVKCIISHTVNCPDLPLTNGVIMYSAGSPGNRPFLSSALHSCNPGYTLIGGTTRFCVSGGSWTGSPPTCQGELCSSCTVCVCEYIIVC